MERVRDALTTIGCMLGIALAWIVGAIVLLFVAAAFCSATDTPSGYSHHDDAPLCSDDRGTHPC